MTPEWARACVEMSRDVNAVVQALFQNGAETVRVKDFHRTGYNLLPELIDSRADVVHGYRKGPVPGIGDPGEAEAVMFLGMHAASGTDGFLAHTLTSRVQQLEVNGAPLAEIQLFASSLEPWGLQPNHFGDAESWKWLGPLLSSSSEVIFSVKLAAPRSKAVS